MKAKRNSWHNWLFRSSFGSAVPYNLCPYFWALVLAISTLPIAWYTHLLNLCFYKKSPEKGVRLWISALLLIGFLGIGSAVFQDENKKIDWLVAEYGIFQSLLIIFFTGMLFFVVGASLIVGIIGLCAFAPGWIRKRRKAQTEKRYENMNDEEKNIYWQEYTRKHNKPKRKWMLIEFIKAKYNRYCPKIDWHD